VPIHLLAVHLVNLEQNQERICFFEIILTLLRVAAGWNHVDRQLIF
jgi:hypothetical protein